MVFVRPLLGAHSAKSVSVCSEPFYSGAHDYDYYWLQNAVQAGSFSIIGAIIASRLPANPVGWLFCAAACTIAVECLSAEYAIYTLNLTRLATDR